jgi:hypothetical protein
MYLHEPQVARFSNWLGDAPKRKPVVDQIQYVDAEVTRVKQDGRLSISFRFTGPMPDDKKAKFIKRFIDPMLQQELGRNLLVNLNQGNYGVSISWRNGKFGFNGTIPLERQDAISGKGSPSVIFLDEEGTDLQHLPTIKDHPDVLLFHELLHAWHIQRGTMVDDENEMERRVIGIGKYTNAKGTENAYRDAKNLQLRCCWNRETL